MSNVYSNTSTVLSLSTVNDKVAAAFLDGLIVVISLSKTDDVFKWYGYVKESLLKIVAKAD